MRTLGKSCVLLVFFFEIVDHGGRRCDTARALARWHEATDALHRAMRPASHHRIRMAIKIASVSRVFFVAIDFVVGHNHTLKTRLWL
jgi:hypothetical protein